ncbi:MAG TPA: isoaspartyl peptidase/L-asparaginase [Gemmatimonadaceae bacterium]|nr:isoaspartyl peptidase/L-asparaginase [Gemmatimonadaceae bacterium]
MTRTHCLIGGLVFAAAATAVAPSGRSAMVREQPRQDPEWGIAIHGGAGSIDTLRMSAAERQLRRDALMRSLRAGHKILAAGGSSLDAVQAAIMVLEDDSMFNAGKGAVLNAEGKTELDAAIMDGKTLNAGAVAGLHRIRNPIALARLVMEKSPHVMMIGDGAEAFAREQGVTMTPESYFITAARLKQYLDAKKADAERTRTAAPPKPGFGTVGAVALDKSGNLAAGTSTGGISMKRFGRVGDAPIIGAGTYASATCAVSATGAGEYFIRLTIARDICARMQYQKLTVRQAADTVIYGVLGKTKGTGGVIVLDNRGNAAMPFNTTGMYRGMMSSDGTAVVLMVK